VRLIGRCLDRATCPRGQIYAQDVKASGTGKRSAPGAQEPESIRFSVNPVVRRHTCKEEKA
jgi:hypothetical protein